MLRLKLLTIISEKKIKLNFTALENQWTELEILKPKSSKWNQERWLRKRDWDCWGVTRIKQ